MFVLLASWIEKAIPTEPNWWRENREIISLMAWKRRNYFSTILIRKSNVTYFQSILIFTCLIKRGEVFPQTPWALEKFFLPEVINGHIPSHNSPYTEYKFTSPPNRFWYWTTSEGCQHWELDAWRYQQVLPVQWVPHHPWLLRECDLDSVSRETSHLVWSGTNSNLHNARCINVHVYIFCNDNVCRCKEGLVLIQGQNATF